MEEELDDVTATTAELTELEDDQSEFGSDDEKDDAEDFAMENAPRPPPDRAMFGGEGECSAATKRK